MIKKNLKNLLAQPVFGLSDDPYYIDGILLRALPPSVLIQLFVFFVCFVVSRSCVL